MRLIILAILIGSLAGLARGEDIAAARVAAATDNARAHLESDLRDFHLSANVTIEQVVDRTQTQRAFHTLMQQAKPVGGPRWLDAESCQVRVEIPFETVRQFLMRAAADHPEASPLSALAIADDTKGSAEQTFGAVGGASSRVDAILPPADAASWRGVSADAIHQAIRDARHDAAQRALEHIAVVDIGYQTPISRLLADPRINSAMMQWLDQQPILRVNFDDNRRVEVLLAVTPQDLCNQLRSALEKYQPNLKPASAAQWSAIADAVGRAIGNVSGEATAAVAATQATEAVSLPAQPPDWINRQLDVEADGTATSRLLAAGVAERAALRRLHEQVDLLPIGDGKCLADAAAANPALAGVLDRAVSAQARLYTVDYLSDTQVSVRMSLDLRDLWETITLPR